MRTLWLYDVAEDLGVLRPEIDCQGYDLVLEMGEIVRHVQLKTSSRSSKTLVQRVQTALVKRPSGCVIWVKFEPETLKLGPFFWFGGEPGCKLQEISDFKVAKHTRGDAQGKKHERPNVRLVHQRSFIKLDSMLEVANRLFGLNLAPK